MGYEYEELVISTVYDLNSEMYPDKEIEIIKSELKEVYAKAKAFNEIVNLLKASHSDYAEDILEDIDVIVMDYRED